MIRSLDYVYLNKNPQAGLAFGDKFDGFGIHGMSITVGTTKSPTEITLDLVRKNQDFSKLNKKLLSALPEHLITLGSPIPEMAKITFGHLALTSYEISKAPDAKTATVTFKDRTILFDKIMIGLLWKHSNGTSPPTRRASAPTYDPLNGLGPPVAPCADVVREIPVPVKIPIACEPCSSFRQKLEQVVRKKYFKIRYISNPGVTVVPGHGVVFIERGYFFNKSILRPGTPNYHFKYLGKPEKGTDNSGYIIFGRERITQGECEFPTTDYTFSELLNAIEEYGFKLGGTFAARKFQQDHFGMHVWRPMADKNPHIRKDWDGTLRSVLDNWCNLNMQSYALSFDGTTLIGFDMSSETSGTQIEKLEKELGDTQLTSYKSVYNPEGEGFLVESLKRKTSLDGCERKGVITRYMKPPRLESFERTLYYYQKVRILNPDDIAGSVRHYGRNKTQFYNSMALAKFSPALREIYLAKEKCFTALGFYMVQKLEPDAAPIRPPGVDPAAAMAGKNLYQMAISAAFLMGDNYDAVAFNALCEGFGTRVRQAGVAPGPEAVAMYKDFFDVYIGYWSRAEFERVQDWDRNASEMLGQYCYFPNGVPTTQERCDELSKRIFSFKTEPSSERYRGRKWMPGDLKALLVDDGINPDAILNNIAANNQIQTLNIGQVPGNSWDTNAKEMEAFLSDPVASTAGTVFQPIPGGVGGNAPGPDPKLVVTDQAGFTRLNHFKEPHMQMTIDQYKPYFALANSLYAGGINLDVELSKYFAGWGAAWNEQLKNMKIVNPDKFVSGSHPSIVVIPKAVKDFHFTNLRDMDGSPIVVNTGVYVAQNPDALKSYQFSQTMLPESDPDCQEKTICEKSMAEEMCDCNKYAKTGDINSESTIFRITTLPNTAAFYNYTANALNVTWTPYYTRLPGMGDKWRKQIKIVYPVLHPLTGNVSKTIKIADTRKSILELFGDFPGFTDGAPNPNKNIMSHDLQWTDATQEIDPIIDPQQGGVTSVIDLGAGIGSNPLRTVGALHNQYKLFFQKNVIQPRETLSFSINGTAFGPLFRNNWVRPEKGLQSWSMSIGANGIKQSFSFGTRPVILPSREDVISKVEMRFARI